MAVGTTADFDLTRNELIDIAYSLIGVAEVSNSDRALAVQMLNSLVRHLDARGDWLWTIDNTETTLTTVSGTQEYSTGAAATDIATNILKLSYAAVLINNDREELDILDKPSSLRTDLQDESNNQPIEVYLERAKLLADNKMLLYPTPNAAYSVVYKYRRPLYDFDGASDNPDFPGTFILPLQKLLAAELAPHFGIPLQERQLLMAQGSEQFRAAAAFESDPPAYSSLQTEYY